MTGLPHAPFTTQVPHAPGQSLGLSEAEVLALIAANAVSLAPAAPVAVKAVVANKEEEASATKDALVTVVFESKATTQFLLELTVAAVTNNFQVFSGAAGTVTGMGFAISFVLAKGKKWKWKAGIGEPNAANWTFQLLN